MTERIFPAEIDELAAVIAFLEEELDKAEASPKLVVTLSVALEELFVNVAHYAYPDSKGTAKIEIDTSGDSVVIRLTDSGIPFDPLAKPDPDVTESAEKRKIGGLGIYMVKKSMDSISYQRQDGKNILTISKRK
ncbi:MAG: ATP-binding protein [Spirochaetia bacterium]|jgi:anti-sigma regulatory factor (Ser/Thr protein kinase)|nr:ATP-binding protein [Spirochaetia bacterium]